MVQICPRCQRANPREAVFCFFDGNLLRQGGPSPIHLPQEFIFPSGRRCRTFDELVQGCQYEWEDARTCLSRGDFARFFALINRHDLVRAAQEGQSQPDPDIALHHFLRHLPANVEGPKLDLNPRRLTLGAVRPGEQRQFQLTVSNQGKGLLQGKVSVSEGGQWLRIGEEMGNEYALKTGRTQPITVHINARGLASPQTYVGKLTIITNGGIAEVPVRLDVTSISFLKPPFQGVSSPRELAERMRTHPKQAAPLLESGEIARWFQLNGWTYPVTAGCAQGVAAVQQFFEGMGLSRPPPLQMSDSSMHFLCVAPEVTQAKVTLRTTAKKWVYAQADTDVPWMRVTTPNVSGPQQVQIAFEIDSSLLDAGRTHLGTVQILANAGQKLAVQVHVDVRWPQEPFTRRLLRPFFVGALLALFWRMLLVIPADVCGKVLSKRPLPQSIEVADWLDLLATEKTNLRGFILSTSWIGVVLAVLLVVRRGARASDLLCSLVAGAGAGIIGSASLGCLLFIFDDLPRTILVHLESIDEQNSRVAWLVKLFKWLLLAQEASPVVWLLKWVVLASLCWTLLGGGAGFLLSGLGQRGIGTLRAIAGPFAWLCRVCGLQRAEAFFLLQG